MAAVRPRNVVLPIVPPAPARNSRLFVVHDCGPLPKSIDPFPTQSDPNAKLSILPSIRLELLEIFAVAPCNIIGNGAITENESPLSKTGTLFPIIHRNPATGPAARPTALGSNIIESGLRPGFVDPPGQSRTHRAHRPGFVDPPVKRQLEQILLSTRTPPIFPASHCSSVLTVQV